MFYSNSHNSIARNAMGISISGQSTPLYVDLDGTFIKSDMLLESLFSAINPDTYQFLAQQKRTDAVLF
jgi:hypothetical protein